MLQLPICRSISWIKQKKKIYYCNIVLHKYFLQSFSHRHKENSCHTAKVVVSEKATSVRVVITVMTGDCEILQSLLQGWCNVLEMTQQQQQQILKFSNKLLYYCTVRIYRMCPFFQPAIKTSQTKEPCASRQTSDLYICLQFTPNGGDLPKLYPDTKIKGRKKTY